MRVLMNVTSFDAAGDPNTELSRHDHSRGALLSAIGGGASQPGNFTTHHLRGLTFPTAAMPSQSTISDQKELFCRSDAARPTSLIRFELLA